MNGVVIDHSKQTMVGYVSDPESATSQAGPRPPLFSFISADDTVHAAALDLLQHTQAAGDLLLKRAHQTRRRHRRFRAGLGGTDHAIIAIRRRATGHPE
ncbi:hypothetical protein [uncultured Bradyrhizobium sp.]|uniref:hypothetical protein n=1 Tax=uncultured Bradyrhizobium sp. TaxID=199684 RepID=UPI0035CC9217